MALPRIAVATLLLLGSAGACYLLPMVGQVRLPLTRQIKNALLLTVAALPGPLLWVLGLCLWLAACLSLGLAGLLLFLLIGLSGPLCLITCGSGRGIRAHVLGIADEDRAPSGGKQCPCKE